MFELDRSLQLPTQTPASPLVIFRSLPAWNISPTQSFNTAVLNHIFSETAEFIDTTSRLSGEQLRWLSFMEGWFKTEVYEEFDQALEKTIEANVTALSHTIALMTQVGYPVKINHPGTDQHSQIVGIGYSTELAGYQAGIRGNEPAEPTLVPLLTSRQLSF